MERAYTVSTETADGKVIHSPFRFKQAKAEQLVRHMDRLTDTRLHHVMLADKSLIPYEPIETDENGIPHKDGKCEVWGLYKVLAELKMAVT